LSGASVVLSTVGGMPVSGTTDSNGEATFDVPYGIYYATVSYLGVSNSIWQGVAGSHNIGMTSFVSLPLILAIVPVILAPIYLVIRRRRNDAKMVREILFG
jgi:hypothetical protein